MKRFLTLALLGATISASAAGGKAEFSNGYYRISNNFTNRYIQVVDNRGSLNYSAASADMAAIRLRLGLENVISDPASVLYIERHGDQYDVKAQNTGINQIIGTYVNIMHNPQNPATYWAYGTKGSITLYLYDYNGNGSKAESWLDTSNKTYPNARNWDITPIDNATDNYFGITPSISADGKYYQPFYASFPFSCASEGMKVYYITKVDEQHGELVYKEISGTVPALTPVIIECANSEPQNNKLNIGGTAAPITGNQLKGVLFDFHVKGHENFVKYDNTKMRSFGNKAAGGFGAVKGEYEYVPRNTVYIPVSATAPAEFKFVDESNAFVDIPAESITLNETNAKIKVGETLALNAVVLPANTTDKTITWTSSDESVAKVDATGKVTAVSAGTATITASCGAAVANCTVIVEVPVISAESVTLSVNSAELKAGETLSLQATVQPDNTTDKTVTWTSSDETVATVDAAGKVTALSVGEATITAACGSVTATCAVKVVPTVVPAGSITLSVNSAELKAGETLSLQATVQPDDTTDKTVTWTSSDETVATVDAAGKVTAIAAGEATITAACGSVTATCAVKVVPSIVLAESITLSETNAELKEGETLTLTATVLPDNTTDNTVTWTSGDETVATVDAAGKVTALSVGDATITATCGLVTATCSVKVVPSIVLAESITLSETNAELKEGETFTLTATVQPDNTTDKTVTWTSSDETVATVDTAGKVTAIAAGEATITAACGAASAICTVTVIVEDPKGEDKEFVGTVTIDMFGDITSIDNQKLEILDIKNDHCTLALYNFSLGDGVELGDIVIENVLMTEVDGDITYKGSKNGLTLGGGLVVADVECEGIETAEGIITIDITVLWNNGETIVPIKVVFTNVVSGIFDITVEDAPAEYYHINGVKATDLTPGLYIKVQGGKATKVLVK